jgi:subtilisin family serine protease
MKKIFNTFLIIALVFSTSTVHAKNTNPKPFKVFKLETKHGDIVYRINDIYSPTLVGSNAKINSDTLINKGYTGQGYTVAVIDTGVDFTHSFLAGKNAGEACFTTNNSCPKGGTQEIGNGSARPVHWHGTHVAGIIAGSNADMHGVAPGAKILGINVFETDGTSYEQNIIDALTYVNSVRIKYNIVSVNMSLGTTKLWTTTCDDASPELTTIIHNLINNNVAVVVAAGNSSSYGMSNPACISGVTSVAATFTTTDNITDFSNIVEFTTFAAPGYLINSSVPGGAFKQASGTSMSTPFVAGAFALYASLKPSGTVSQRVADLQQNCPKAYDAPTKISICRLDFTYVATGTESPVTTTTTTIPTPGTTQPPVVTLPPIPTTSTTLVYKISVGKPRLNFIQLYSTGTVYVNYTDPVYGKELIANYILTCGTNTYTFTPIPGATNHIYSIANFPRDITSCYLRPVDSSNVLGPVTQNIPVYKV